MKPDREVHELKISILISRYEEELNDALFASGLDYDRIDDSHFIVYSENDILLERMEFDLNLRRHGFGSHRVCYANFVKNPKLETTSERIERSKRESEKLIEQTKKIMAMGKVPAYDVDYMNNLLKSVLNKGVNNG